MALASGTRIGVYEVVATLGRGGMGEVYRARDVKLNREVALKVLPESFAADSDRLARFQREARVLASLNHPHIGAIYGLEDTGQAPTLVLELVEGRHWPTESRTGQSRCRRRSRLRGRSRRPSTPRMNKASSIATRLDIAAPRYLFTLPPRGSGYEPSADGQKFLVNAVVSSPSPISVILNWKPPQR